MKQSGIIIGMIAFVLLCPAANAIGLGVAPANFVVEDALKGGSYERTITVYNTGDESGEFTLDAEGECRDWITFYDANNPDEAITSVTISGNGQAKILAMFRIPKEIANGDYSTTIYAASSPASDTSGGAVAHAVIRIPCKVVLEVTGTQILKGTVKSITTADTEINYPLKIKVEFKNEGNVIAKPNIAVTITKDSELVDSFVHDETGIKTDSEDTITVLWNTTEQRTGDYTADVEVSLGGEVLTTKSLPFKILPFGTLTRQGELTSITTEGEPMINRVIKILADFENTGKIDSRATFKGEVYCDGEFIDVIESDEMIVEIGETSRLTSYYKIQAPGKYEVKGNVLYEGKETDTKDISFDVDSTNSKSGGNGIPGFAGSMSIIVIIIISILYKKR